MVCRAAANCRKLFDTGDRIMSYRQNNTHMMGSEGVAAGDLQDLEHIRRRLHLLADDEVRRSWEHPLPACLPACLPAA